MKRAARGCSTLQAPPAQVCNECRCKAGTGVPSEAMHVSERRARGVHTAVWRERPRERPLRMASSPTCRNNTVLPRNARRVHAASSTRTHAAPALGRCTPWLTACVHCLGTRAGVGVARRAAPARVRPQPPGHCGLRGLLWLSLPVCQPRAGRLGRRGLHAHVRMPAPGLCELPPVRACESLSLLRAACELEGPARESCLCTFVLAALPPRAV